jgi:hypothetical protein
MAVATTVLIGGKTLSSHSLIVLFCLFVSIRDPCCLGSSWSVSLNLGLGLGVGPVTCLCHCSQKLESHLGIRLG